MDGQDTANSGSDSPQPGNLRTILWDAVRFWEPRRILYNAVLTAVVIAWFGFTWPHFRPALNPHSLLLLLILAGMANLCYCAAYIVDIPVQYSVSRAALLRGRWELWLLGMILALVLANYWIVDEIYPFV
jgi:hypothetical protein